MQIKSAYQLQHIITTEDKSIEKAKIREISRSNKRERNAARTTVKFISQLYHCIVALGLNANAKSSFIHLFNIFSHPALLLCVLRVQWLSQNHK